MLLPYLMLSMKCQSFQELIQLHVPFVPFEQLLIVLLLDHIVGAPLIEPPPSVWFLEAFVHSNEQILILWFQGDVDKMSKNHQIDIKLSPNIIDPLRYQCDVKGRQHSLCMQQAL